MAQKKAHLGLAVSIYRKSDGFSLDESIGNLAEDRQFFIASTTKLYITAIMFQLAEQGRLGLDDLVSAHLPAEDIDGLHMFKGKAYADQLTLRQLLAHTSGLPDYFQQKQDGRSLMARLTAGKDQFWTYRDVISWAKDMPAKFPPATKGKAFYSDTNFQLLGRIIEIVEGKSIDEVFKEYIFDPLELSKTYLYRDSADKTPQMLNFKNAPLDIRKAMIGFGPDGGIVSTAPEQMVFLRAFFEGKFFDPVILPQMYDWQRINFPLQYGTGMMLFRLPRLFTLIKKQPDLIGHAGLSGNFAFYAPESGVYLTGTVNQIAKPGASFKLMLGILAAL